MIYTSTGARSDRRAVPGSVFLSKPFRIQDAVDLAGAMLWTPPRCARRVEPRAGLARY